MKVLFPETLAFSVAVVYMLALDEEYVAPALKVAHFECHEMMANTQHAPSEVRPWHIIREEVGISKARITLSNKHFWRELKATKFRVEHQQEEWQ